METTLSEPDPRDTIDIIRERRSTCGRGIDIMITNVVTIPGVKYRWSYRARTVRTLREGRFAVVPPDQQAWEGEAYNAFEAINDECRCVQGSGDNTLELPDRIELQPLGPGAVILDAQLVNTPDGRTVALFNLPNNIDGECLTS